MLLRELPRRVVAVIAKLAFGQSAVGPRGGTNGSDRQRPPPFVAEGDEPTAARCTTGNPSHWNQSRIRTCRRLRRQEAVALEPGLDATGSRWELAWRDSWRDSGGLA